MQISNCDVVSMILRIGELVGNIMEKLLNDKKESLNIKNDWEKAPSIPNKSKDKINEILSSKEKTSS